MIEIRESAFQRDFKNTKPTNRTQAEEIC